MSGAHEPGSSWTPAELRADVQRWPADNGLYRLCLDVPPLDPRRRPSNTRWIFFDAGRYPAFAAAYALGRRGVDFPQDLADKPARAAWLAGWDSRPTP